MKKNLMIIVALVLVMTHIIPPYNISYANDEVNECENMRFTVQTIKENDEKITGTSGLSQKLDIEFKTKGKTETVNSNGKFEFKVDDGFLEVNDVITISNDYFKVETEVASEESSSTSLQSEQYVACPVVEEASDSEESATEEFNTEEASDSGDTATAEPDTEDASSEESATQIEERESKENLSRDELARIEDASTEYENEAKLIIKEFESKIKNIDEENNNITPYASLTEVQLLTDIVIDATLTPNETAPLEGTPYSLNLNLNGTGLADVELVNPDRTVVFYAPDLAGELVNSGQTATVQVDILPLTMDDLPVLNTALEGLQGGLTGLVTGLLTGIDAALPALIPPSLVEVKGLDELNAAINNLNNLNTALANVLSYTDNVEYTINDDGTIVVDFSDGLANHLETAVIDIVQAALNDVNTAVNNLEINILSGLPLVGSLLRSLTNGLLIPLIGNVTGLVNTLGTNLTNGVIDLTNDLASAQVIGNTNVNLDVLVNNPPGDVEGTIPVLGAGIQDSVIDVALLNSLESGTTVTFPEQPEPILTQPNNIVFNTTEIMDEETIIYRQGSDYTIEVTDERRSGNWTLAIQALTPLMTEDGNHALPESLYYFQDGEEPKLIEGIQVPIATRDQNLESDVQNIVWEKDEGILLRTNPIEAVAGEEYSTTINWTLTDGP